MCGINVIIGHHKAEIEPMQKAIYHRGPDQDGIFLSDFVTLGNRRLSIIDTSEKGRQPMTDASGRFTIVYNGEIYNYKAIRKELEKTAVRFRGNSDTEVIVEGYAKWGAEAIEKLQGMWALAIYDAKEKTLFLSRDPFGIKPLYAYDDGNTFAFSSEIRGLIANPSVKKDINPSAVRDLLLMGYVPAPRAIMKNIRAFLPGEEMLINLETKKLDSKIRTLTYDASRKKSPPSDEELFETLKDSVKKHLIADVPVGLFFSGGTDSSVLALLLRDLGVSLRAYHVAIDGRIDTRYQSEISKYFGIDPVVVSFRAEDVPGRLEQFWSAMDQPLADSSLLPTFVVSQRAVQDVKVVLSGEGGDELFSGYERHRRLAGHTNPLLAASRVEGEDLLSSIFQTAISSAPRLISLLPKLQGLSRRYGTLTNDPLGTYLAESAIGSGLISQTQIKKTMAERIDSREHPDGILAIDRLIYLPDDLLQKIDAATMAVSLEGRVPFLNREVFATVAAAPLSWKFADGNLKAPLKRILAKKLPKELVDRPKTGFSVSLNKYVFPYERERINEAIKWYLKNFTGLEPALDKALGWGIKNEKNMEKLIKAMSYAIYALLTLYIFRTRLLNNTFS